ncbi:MAG TPA: DUF3293 domain-containing protein, partial [Gammaproteobacteria bacterium]|nr:DUF3293 domain-containing protein [Gammaproteobacteria bacterium]
AWNPGTRRPSSRENREANRRLAAEIVRQGWSFWPARGRNENGLHVEESFAVERIAADAAIALAHRFHQAAVFYWDGSEACILPASPAGMTAT